MEEGQFRLTEEQFERLAPYLPTKTRGVPRVDDRRVICGIVQVLKSGCRWVDAPAAYGPGKALCNRFVRWADKGIRQGIFQALAAAEGPAAFPGRFSRRPKPGSRCSAATPCLRPAPRLL